MGREFRINGSEKILATIRKFSATEKAIFGVFVIIAITSSLFLAWTLNKQFLIPVPAHGGSLVEGVVGLPRSINPILAFSDIDHDLTGLIYSGLMKYDNGKIVPDMAENYTVSNDGLTYSFTLRDDLRFHDGMPLTTEDVEFTVQKAQDNIIKSLRRADWANVIVKKISATEIQFTLKQPYSAFLTNTTIGIIPKHIWDKVEPDQFIFSQYNIEPIGSGPYEIENIERDSGGIPIYYSLSSFSRYHDGEPFIERLDIYFYPNEKTLLDAYGAGYVESMARISASAASGMASSTISYKILRAPLPRIFGIFLNQNQAPVFAKSEVRHALGIATDKKRIITEVLYGYGVESNSPIPSSKDTKDATVDIEGAKDLLEKAKVKNLEFSIATADSPDLKKVAEIIKKEWEKIGAKVSIKVFEYGDLYQNIITTRKYDALLFGESISKDIDLYAFWHSSQRNSPGLNVAMYVNSKADKLLEDARITIDEEKREEKYSQFEKIIQDEMPAIFLYSPELIYVIPDKLRGAELKKIVSPTDRFEGINKWYVMTDNVWKIFDNKEIKK